MNEWENLGQALSKLVSTGPVEVHEDGQWLASLAGFRSELRTQGKQTLIHLWSSETSLVRRVLRISSCELNRIQLEVQRFGPGKPATLEFLALGRARSDLRIGREQFKARFARMLGERFPDAQIGSLTTAADLKRSFSSLYTRGVMTEQGRSWAVMAAAPSENSTTFDGILSFGLLWLDWTRQHPQRHPIQGLRVFLPKGHTQTTMERARALNPALALEVYDFSENDSLFRRVEHSSQGNVESWLSPRRDAEIALAEATDLIRSIRSLLGGYADDIEVSVPSGTQDVCFRFCGLEFARRIGGQLYCGLGDDRRPVGAPNSTELAKLLARLSQKRNPCSQELNDPLYRASPERWLETMVRRDPEKLDAQLVPEYLYSQVPALAAGERGIIDLLGVTRTGRLVVIELKASEDLHLPLQAVDYWLRVRRHLTEGDFQRYGYFQGIEIRPDSPLVWLVAPSLHFHPANETQLRYFSPELKVFRIGINENWRKRLRVISRQ
jgi:hypothetical protein